jgi:hypothetical protein
MKKTVKKASGNGLNKLIGENVLLLCANYFYHGKLVGVNSDCVMLENPGIVYETGEWTATQFKDKQNLPTKHWYVLKSAIESFGRIF